MYKKTQNITEILNEIVIWKQSLKIIVLPEYSNNCLLLFHIQKQISTKLKTSF